MADHKGQGYVVEFKLFDHEACQRRDDAAEKELEALRLEMKRAEESHARFLAPLSTTV